jgi:hypothetical protein
MERRERDYYASRISLFMTPEMSLRIGRAVEYTPIFRCVKLKGQKLAQANIHPMTNIAVG